MNTPTVYVICDANCKFEGMTKEQIYTAIVQAVNEGTIGDIDTGFITTIKTVTGTPLKFFVGEQAEYDALTDEDKQNLFAIITNDTTKDGILNAIKELQETATTHGNRLTAHEERLTTLENHDVEFDQVFNIELSIDETDPTKRTGTIELSKLKIGTVYLVRYINFYVNYTGLYIHSYIEDASVCLGEGIRLDIAPDDLVTLTITHQNEPYRGIPRLIFYKLGVT